MTVEVNAIKTVEELVRSAGERLDRLHGRTEDRLKEDFRRHKVEQIVREVLIEFLTGEAKPSLSIARENRVERQ